MRRRDLEKIPKERWVKLLSDLTMEEMCAELKASYYVVCKYMNKKLREKEYVVKEVETPTEDPLLYFDNVLIYKTEGAWTNWRNFIINKNFLYLEKIYNYEGN